MLSLFMNFTGWLSTNLKSCLYICTTVNWHTAPTLSFSPSSWGVTDCRTTGTSLREIKFFFSFFTVAPFFNFLKHILSHKAGIHSVNASHVGSPEVSGWASPVLWEKMYKYVFFLTCKIITYLPTRRWCRRVETCKHSFRNVSVRTGICFVCLKLFFQLIVARDTTKIVCNISCDEKAHDKLSKLCISDWLLCMF